MRFESVTAHVFGPIRAETLDLAPGMNVIHGPNEAGKSTWHAALYAGLCGVRRARGQPRREDREFAERHRPWDGEGWEVGAVITLGDGRRIELRHDLAGGVDSSARDADIADRDYSNEIMNEGAPDGSRWLGLDRRSFLSTACVPAGADPRRTRRRGRPPGRTPARGGHRRDRRDGGGRAAPAARLPRRACRHRACPDQAARTVRARVDRRPGRNSRRRKPRTRSTSSGGPPSSNSNVRSRRGNGMPPLCARCSWEQPRTRPKRAATRRSC